MELSPICPICASTEQEPLSSKHKRAQDIALMRCRACQYIYRPAPPSSDDTVPAMPQKALSTSRTRETSELAYRRRLTMVEESVQRGALLELCCGDAEFLALARQRGWRAAGMAASPDAVRVPEGIGMAGRLGEGTWPAGSFDAVVLWRVLEHSEHAEEIIRLAAHYCCVDGILALETISGESYGALGQLAQWRDDPDSLSRVFTAGSLTRFLHRFGFRIERLERDHSAPVNSTPVATPNMLGSPMRHRQQRLAPVCTQPRVRPAEMRPSRQEWLTVIARYVP